ncbi:MAG: rhodanese-like domain-containing protein [Thermoanaerobaculia bacterium]|nr:rhodanese-like domain-containing protein [Thermoanaerobaculia bacterium]
MAVMVAGVILIVALVGWALTRTVEPTPAPLPETSVAQSPVPGAPASATSAPASTEPAHTANEGVSRIAVADLKAKFDRGEVTVIDVRDSASYQIGHIPGALHIAFASVESQIAFIPKGKPIVTYCT